MLPLEDLRVIDLTQYVAGPYCALLLADLGAEVIKVERPGSGDVYRRQGPHFVKGESVSFLCLNRNKKSLTLDLKAAEAREILYRLVKNADVFLENSKPGTLERLGLGYEVLQTVNPRLIYASISGFGQQGPDRDKGGYDLIMQGITGIMDMTGEPGQPPAKVPVAALDYGAGMYAALGILSAVVAREKTGRGQWVQTSLLETGISWLLMHAAEYFLAGNLPQRLGSASPFFAPYQAVRARDGYVTLVGTGGKDSWGRLCRALGLDHLVNDPRFADNAGRIAHRQELIRLVEEKTSQLNTVDLLRLLEKEEIPCGPIHPLAQALANHQVLACDMVQELDHPTVGKMKTTGLPIKLMGTPGALRMPPPLLGQHTEEILRSLGYSKGEIHALREKGII